MFGTALTLLTSALCAVVPTQVAHNQHLATLQSQQSIHKNAVGKSYTHARELADFEMSLHDRTLRRAQQLHYETVSYELDIARREVARDVWSQKNEMVQTLMVINTVMVISIYSLLVQGYQFSNGDSSSSSGGSSVLVVVLSEGYTFAFTCLCSLSVACHVLSIFVAFKLNSRTIQFQMHNPKTKYRPCGRVHLDFDDFFSCHGATLERLAFYLFYLGTSLSLITSAIFIWTVLLGRASDNNNSSLIGKLLSVGIVNTIVAVVGVVASVVVYFLWK